MILAGALSLHPIYYLHATTNIYSLQLAFRYFLYFLTLLHPLDKHLNNKTYHLGIKNHNKISYLFYDLSLVCATSPAVSKSCYSITNTTITMLLNIYHVINFIITYVKTNDFVRKLSSTLLQHKLPPTKIFYHYGIKYLVLINKLNHYVMKVAK